MTARGLHAAHNPGSDRHITCMILLSRIERMHSKADAVLTWNGLHARGLSGIGTVASVYNLDHCSQKESGTMILAGIIFYKGPSCQASLLPIEKPLFFVWGSNFAEV